MRLLLDTHIYLWGLNDDPKLSQTARSLILHANEVYVSSVSIWEASIKASLGKLNVNINELTDAIISRWREMICKNHVASSFILPVL